MIKRFSGKFANTEFTWNGTISIMSIINFLKVPTTFEKLEQWPQTWKSYENENSLLLRSSSNFRLIVNRFNHYTQANNNIDPEKDNVIPCKYFGTQELLNMKIFNKNQINVIIWKKECSLNERFDD